MGFQSIMYVRKRAFEKSRTKKGKVVVCLKKNLSFVVHANQTLLTSGLYPESSSWSLVETFLLFVSCFMLGLEIKDLATKEKI